MGKKSFPLAIKLSGCGATDTNYGLIGNVVFVTVTDLSSVFISQGGRILASANFGQSNEVDCFLCLKQLSQGQLQESYSC